MYKTGCIIMASGTGKRFGGDKLTADFLGRPMIEIIISETEKIGFQKRIVVTRNENVKRLCEESKVEVIYHSFENRNEAVRLGIEAMQDMDGCIFCPSDQPLLKRESIINLKKEFEKSGSGMYRLSWKGQAGAPVLFGKEYFCELGELPEKRGGSFLAEKYKENVKLVEAGSEYELQDVDTKEDLENLLALIREGNIK